MSLTFFLPLSTYPDPTPKAGLLRAFDMAATLGGEVTALTQEVDIADVQNVFADALIDVSGMIAAAEARSHAAAQELIGEVKHLAKRFQLPLEVRSVVCRPEAAGDLIAAAARTFDYSLLVPAASSDEQMAVAEAVLFGSGGPTWVFPEGETTSHLASAAIAWDGGRASARAVRDALPVLSKVGKATILCATDDKAIAAGSAEALRGFLYHHGIEADTRQFARGEQLIGRALQDAAIGAGAGLMVMGAYGHSRIREFVLGGATRTVLADRRLPILMSH
jgi:nucleotide-binding universal stress UspA family protein